MSRLLHAAARGARIEVLHNECWYQACAIEVHDIHGTQRIHPDDAHLQYGPISTALRQGAADDAEAAAEIPYIQGFWAFTRSETDTFDQDEKHRSLFLLILAEALADSGL
jgi:hypothetical protein